MSKPSLREQYAAGLVARGETQVASTTGRTLCFTRKAGGHYFLGKSGSLRVCATGKSVVRSKPCSDAFKTKLIEEAQSCRSQ